MQKPKNIQVRHAILKRLEDGVYQAGDQLPGTRELASNLNISFLKAQQAVESLVHDGVLEAKSRRGTFVRPEWRTRVLHEHMSIFNKANVMPWVSGLQNIVAPMLPDLRFTHGFRQAMFELRTTLYLQRNHDNYMDLSELVGENIAGKDFFQEPFEGFRSKNGYLVGVPIIFSPRVLYINPAMFDDHGIPRPDSTTTWSEFLDIIKQWKGIVPAHRIINCSRQSFFWQMFVIGAGGTLFDPAFPEGISIDSESVLRGLEAFREFEGLLDPNRTMIGDDFYEDFKDQKAPMVIAARQLTNILKHRGHTGWDCLPLPRVAEKVHVSSQATDLICIRKSCNNLSLARDIIKAMLSPEVQNYLAKQSYGIPIRKQSADMALDGTDPRDKVFVAEMKLIKSEPFMPHAALVNMVYNGIGRLLHENGNLQSGLRDLASAARLFQSVQDFANEYSTSTSNLTPTRDLP